MKATVLAMLVMVMVLGTLAWAADLAPAAPSHRVQQVRRPVGSAVAYDPRKGCPDGYVPIIRYGPNAAGLCYPGAKCDFCVLPSQKFLERIPKDWYRRYVSAPHIYQPAAL